VSGEESRMRRRLVGNNLENKLLDVRRASMRILRAPDVISIPLQRDVAARGPRCHFPRACQNRLSIEFSTKLSSGSCIDNSERLLRQVLNQQIIWLIQLNFQCIGIQNDYITYGSEQPSRNCTLCRRIKRAQERSAHCLCINRSAIV